MLLDFKVRNYRSFRDETVFSMEPTSPQRDLQETLLSDAAGGWNYHANSLAVVYGPNAAGKSNLVSALDAFRAIVLRGNIRNAALQQDAAGSAAQLELMPNMHAGSEPSTGFDIAFVENGMLVEYGFDMDLGGFLNQGYGRRIVRERLRVNGTTVFDRRAEGTTWGDLETLRQKVPVPADLTPEEYALIVRAIGNKVLPDELLLTNGFRTAVDPDLAEVVLGWFRGKLLVMFQAENAPVSAADLSEEADASFRTSSHIRAIMEEIGLKSRQLGFPVRDGEMAEEMYSLLQDAEAGKTALVPARDIESRGTVRLAWLVRAAASVLGSGGVLVADELDASVHPAVVRALMGLFHEEETNPRHAQLIFTTHNPAYLDSDLCRRDELRFVERESDEAGSRQWSLADLRCGETAEKDYQGEYRRGTYGAYSEPDLRSMFLTSAEE